MTQTEWRPDGQGHRWYCRCGEHGEGFTDIQFARKAGDVHLAEANHA